ncbi:hypothetical protein RI103_34425 [Paraburkholderia sp. FT54]|nr:hypothetical protein [Paraburkholderia sp. FT54]WNC95141.1 hypothetical protein RI103_34425 [Paraburkholderia sp. FT54]
MKTIILITLVSLLAGCSGMGGAMFAGALQGFGEGAAQALRQ